MLPIPLIGLSAFEEIVVVFFCLVLAVALLVLAVAMVPLWLRVRSLEQQQKIDRATFLSRITQLDQRILSQRQAEQSTQSPKSTENEPILPASALTPAADYNVPTNHPPSTTATPPVTPCPTSPPPAYKPATPVRPMDTAQWMASRSTTQPPASPAPPPKPASPAVPPRPSSPAKKTTSMEEQLGSKLYIWIGAVALALAGAFLVKYSFDNNLITPWMRVILGTLFGFGLLGGSEWMRNRSARISEALAGAGVADLFACLLAARTLYDLIGSSTAFFLMLALTAGALILSLRQGKGVAFLGLLGGFITPSLIGSGNNAVVPLLGYFILLQVGMAVLCRYRGWSLLLSLTLLGSFVWAIVLSLMSITPLQRWSLEFFLIGSAAVYIVSAAFAREERDPRLPPQWSPVRLSMLAVSASIILLSIMTYRAKFAVMDLVMFGLAGAAVMVLARVKPAYSPMVWLAGGATALAVYAWPWQYRAGEYFDLQVYAWTILAFGILYAGGCYAGMWRSRREAYWATGSAISAVIFFLIAWIGLDELATPTWFKWWMLPATIGVIYTLGALPVWRWRQSIRQGEHALGALSVVASVFFMIAAYRGMADLWFLPVWAGIVALAAWLTRQQRIAGLASFAAVVATLCLWGLVIPGPAEITYSTRPVLNAIGGMYALVALGIGLAAWLLRSQKKLLQHADILRLVALLIGLIGLLWLIRHGFHPENVLRGRVRLWEWATVANLCLLASHGLFNWDREWPRWPQRVTAILSCLVGLFASFVGTLLLANPWWRSEWVGPWPVFNGLLYIYGLPAALVLLYISTAGRFNKDVIQKIAGGIALFLTFILVTFLVRQAYTGSMLRGPAITPLEMYSYSVAWIFLGIALVTLGIRWDSKSLRYASLVVMLLAIGKVFLLDTAHLKDLYRVLSFLGLGVSLMVMGYVYQRFVFRKQAQDDVS